MPAATREELTSPRLLSRQQRLEGLTKCIWILWFAIAVIVPVRPAQGLGVLVADTSSSSIKASRTLIARDDDGKTFQMTEIDFEGEIGWDFVWVLPVPAGGEEILVTTCGASHFENIAKLAQPRILLRQREDGGGCGEAEIPTPHEADIKAHSFSQYDLAPNSRTHTPFENFEALEDWIHNIGGYSIQESNHGVLNHYVANTYHFVAVEVSPTHSTGRVCLSLEYDPPSQREYDHLLPMKTGAVSSEATEPVSTEILIYALDEGTVRPLTKQDGGYLYRAVTINPHEITAIDSKNTSYDTVFIGAVGDPPGFVIEYSGELSRPLEWTGSTDLWLTRLRTRMNPSELTGPDLALQIDAPEEVDRDYSIVIARAGRGVDPAVALCTLALFGTLVARRRAKGR